MIGMVQTLGVYHYGYFTLKSREIQYYGPMTYPTREAPTASPKSLPISGAENEPSGHMRCCSYTVEVGPFQAARF